MANMDWDCSFKSPGDFIPSDYKMSAPDFPDVHNEWVRHEWVSGAQGLLNAAQLRMNLPRLYDYGGLSHCSLRPDVPHAVCGEEQLMGMSSPSDEDSTTSPEDGTDVSQTPPVESVIQTEDVGPAAKTTEQTIPKPTADMGDKLFGGFVIVAAIGIIAVATGAVDKVKKLIKKK